MLYHYISPRIYILLLKTQTDKQDNRLLCNTKIAVARGVYFHFTSSPAQIRQSTTSGVVNTGEQVILIYSFSVLSLMSSTTQTSNILVSFFFSDTFRNTEKKNWNLETPPTTALNCEYATDTNVFCFNTNRLNKK